MKKQQNKAHKNHTAALAQRQDYAVSNTLVNYYLALMFGFFPLFLTDKYVHARTDKFWLFLILTGIMTAAVAVTAILRHYEDKRNGISAAFIKPISTTDIMMLCFFGFALISTVFSPYFTMALTGDGARNNGLILLLAYTLMYFAVTRHFVFKDYVWAVYLIISSVVAILAILNFFYIDPLGLLKGYEADVAKDFGSTIGNKNLIAAFTCLFLPVAIMLFVVTEKRFLRVLSGFAVAFAYTGLICADSSSDILGLLVILPVTAIFSARKLAYLRRYLLALTILFASGKLLCLFSTALQNNNKGFEFMQEFIVFSPLMYLPIAVCGALYLLTVLIGKRDDTRYPAKAVQIILIVLFTAGIITGIGLFVYYSVIDTRSDIGNMEKLLRFSDKWGTHRGFIWRASLEEYSRFDLFGLLFGSGPDTLYQVFSPHFSELLRRFGDSSTDCAHNEFINYLITQGALGLIAYLGLMLTAIVRGLKAARRDPLALVFIAAVIGYLAQSTVNLYTPITTPFLFIFVALTEAVSRRTESVMSK